MKKTVLSILGIVLLIFIVFLLLGTFFTNQYVSDEMKKLKMVEEKFHPENFNKNEISNLPFRIRNYFTQTIEDKAQMPNSVSMKQTAKFKTSINSDWKELTSDMYYVPLEPAYLWDAEIEMSEILWTRATESYVGGRGAIIIKLLSSMKVTELTGEKVDKSTLSRYLTEAVMFPTALLPSKSLKWKKLEGNKAEAELRHNNEKVKAVFYFNSDNLIDKVTTQNRYRTTRAGFQQTDYTVHFSEYQNIDGFTIPTYFEVEWNLPDSNFKFGEFRISDVQFGYHEGNGE
jgi:hypothetical protein